MGKLDRLRNRVEPFAVLFWALGIVIANTWPCLLTRHHSTDVRKACPYMVIVGSILSEDALAPPLFRSRYIIYLQYAIDPPFCSISFSKTLIREILQYTFIIPSGENNNSEKMILTVPKYRFIVLRWYPLTFGFRPNLESDELAVDKTRFCRRCYSVKLCQLRKTPVFLKPPSLAGLRLQAL